MLLSARKRIQPASLYSILHPRLASLYFICAGAACRAGQPPAGERAAVHASQSVNRQASGAAGHQRRGGVAQRRPTGTQPTPAAHTLHRSTRGGAIWRQIQGAQPVVFLGAGAGAQRDSIFRYIFLEILELYNGVGIPAGEGRACWVAQIPRQGWMGSQGPAVRTDWGSRL